MESWAAGDLVEGADLVDVAKAKVADPSDGEGGGGRSR